MELKFFFVYINAAKVLSSNRTFMELKFVVKP